MLLQCNYYSVVFFASQSVCARRRHLRPVLPTHSQTAHLPTLSPLPSLLNTSLRPPSPQTHHHPTPAQHQQRHHGKISQPLPLKVCRTREGRVTVEVYTATDTRSVSLFEVCGMSESRCGVEFCREDEEEIAVKVCRAF